MYLDNSRLKSTDGDSLFNPEDDIVSSPMSIVPQIVIQTYLSSTFPDSRSAIASSGQ
jgi:hypothetical protein